MCSRARGDTLFQQTISINSFASDHFDEQPMKLTEWNSGLVAKTNATAPLGGIKQTEKDNYMVNGKYRCDNLQLKFMIVTALCD